MCSSQGMLLSAEKCVWMEELSFMDGLWLLAAEVAGSSCHNYYTINNNNNNKKSFKQRGIFEIMLLLTVLVKSVSCSV